ncbi:pentapeptide repeat-containing protein [Thalassospira xianhensis]|uniref:pentapeptide repeat-containing protein n=1 Tax=Thalassospira xianhensis TaxID=478503 RepID=UPI000DEDB0BC|nr:pentapeptide repeat-containing protein [Thalassospira xianhensis]
MKTWEISDIDGNLLHAGRAKTRKKLIENLVRDGKSFERADLAHADLSGLELSKGNFTSALLTKADLRGTQLQSAILRNAILDDAQCHGARFDRADLNGATITGTQFAGARATYASFRGARITGADFTKVSASSSVFSHAHISDTSFTGSRMLNADFGNSTVLACDFSGTRLETSLFTNAVDDSQTNWTRHLPNRTRNSIIVGCTFDRETVLSPTVPAFKLDAIINKMAEFGLFASTALAMLGVGSQLPEFLANEEVLASNISSGVGFLGVFVGAYLIKEGVGQYVEEKVKKGLDYVLQRVRGVYNELDRWGVHRSNIVMTMARGRSCKLMKDMLASKAPEAMSKGFWPSFKSFWSGLGEVIICDRRHLALALGAVSANRKRSYSLPRDIVLARPSTQKHSSEPTLKVLSFLKDGKSSAVWECPGERTITTLYSADNSFIGCWAEDGVPNEVLASYLPDCHTSGERVFETFVRDLLASHDWEQFTFPSDTHYCQAGADGTLLVFRAADRRLDNPDGPAVIFPDDESRNVRNGTIQVHQPFGR